MSRLNDTQLANIAKCRTRKNTRRKLRRKANALKRSRFGGKLKPFTYHTRIA